MGKFCGSCGKEISEGATFCGNCGSQISIDEQNVSAVDTNKYNGMAIAGFVLSFFVPILGLIFSSVGMSKTKKIGQKGYGLAVAGLVISIVNWILGIILQLM